MDEIDDIDLDSDLLFTLTPQTALEGLARIRSTTGQGVPYAAPSGCLALEQNCPIAQDDRADCISNPWFRLHYS